MRQKEHLSLIGIYKDTLVLHVIRFEDVYNEQLLKIIESKASGKQAKPEKFEAKPTPAKNLMAQLKASLEKRKKTAS